MSGLPFPELLRETVFAPLPMADSSYDVDFPARHTGATASGHDSGGELIAGGWRAMPEGAGTGLWTTPADLCRVACDVMAAWSGQSAQLLDQVTARQMLTAQVGGWGLGWTIEQVDGALRCGHGGSNIGYKCRLVFWPELGMGAAVMTNADDGTYLVEEIMTAIGREYGWPGAVLGATQRSEQNDRAILTALTGEWHSEGLPALRVESAAGGLLLTLDTQPLLSLRPVGDLTFAAEVVNLEVRFSAGAGDVAAQMIVRQRGEDMRYVRGS